jgi:DHA2 family methylenomycin A resistance protein-like MFS transporter
MRGASLKLQAPSGAPSRSAAKSTPSKLAFSLTLAAMSLGYGVVQLDVTIVNTALHTIGTPFGGGVAELQWVVIAGTMSCI